MFRLILALFLFLISVGSPCRAATADSDAAAQLANQAESFRKEKEKEPLALPEKPAITLQEKQETSQTPKGGKLYLKKIQIEGNTVFNDEVLGRLTLPYENREISSEEMDKLIQNLTGFYRSQGYLTSQAYFPPQNVKEGALTIHILEGKIGEIRPVGNRHFSSAYYREALRLKKDRIFRYQDLERSLYALNKKPDRHVKADLVAGQTSGTSDLVLNIQETNPFHAAYAFNNRGTKLTHYQRHEIRLNHNNITGHGDSLDTSLSLTDEGSMTAGSAQYAYTLLPTNTLLTLSTSYVESMLTRALRATEIKGKYFSVAPTLSQNFISRPELTLDGILGLEIKDSKSLIDDTRINYDRMRVLKLGPHVSFFDAQGNTALRAEVHQGLPGFLGGSDSVDTASSRVGAGGEFTYYTTRFSRIQRIPASSLLILRADGQWTDDLLTAVEQYRIGGAYSVRGYPEGDALGDLGYTFSAETNTPVPILPPSWKMPLKFAAFIDGGKTFLLEKSSETAVKHRFLLGAGLGFRLNFADTGSFQCDFGWPIGDDSSEKNRMQTHVAFQIGF